MARRTPPARPIQPVQRELLTRTEAAASLGVSESSYKRHVEGDLKTVIVGGLTLVPPSELARWADENARHDAA